MEEPMARPLEIDLDRTRELRIHWTDGRRSVCPLTLLRKACPCAECRQEREQAGKNSLPVLQSPAAQLEMVIAEQAELVGQYGLRITWQDGHSAGIYDYALLRSLSPLENGPEGSPA